MTESAHFCILLDWGFTDSRIPGRIPARIPKNIPTDEPMRYMYKVVTIVARCKISKKYEINTGRTLCSHYLESRPVVISGTNRPSLSLEVDFTLSDYETEFI